VSNYLALSLWYAAGTTAALWTWCLLVSGLRWRNIREDIPLLMAISFGILVLSFLWPLVIIAMVVLIVIAIRS
jgi:hypothetical protein